MIAGPPHLSTRHLDPYFTSLHFQGSLESKFRLTSDALMGHNQILIEICIGTGFSIVKVFAVS